MRLVEIILTVCGLLLGAAYAAFHDLKDRRISLGIKTLASVCFVALGAVCYAHYADSFAKVTVCALALGALADIIFGMRHVVEKTKKPLLFNTGVSVFALGHVLYIIAIFLLVRVPVWVMLLSFIPATLICMIPKLVYKVKYGRLRFVIFGYAVILSCMLVCAVYYAATCGNPHNAAVLATAAALFAFSDAVLLIEIFVCDSRFLNFLNLIPYYSAQLLFALSVGYLVR